MIKSSWKTNYRRETSSRSKLYKQINSAYKIEEILIKINIVTSKMSITMKYFHRLRKISK
jgi:hypothetical protein